MSIVDGRLYNRVIVFVARGEHPQQRIWDASFQIGDHGWRATPDVIDVGDGHPSEGNRTAEGRCQGLRDDTDRPRQHNQQGSEHPHPEIEPLPQANGAPLKRRSDGGQRSFREYPCWRSMPVEFEKWRQMVGSGGISEPAAMSGWCMPIRIPLIRRVRN